MCKKLILIILYFIMKIFFITLQLFFENKCIYKESPFFLLGGLKILKGNSLNNTFY